MSCTRPSCFRSSLAINFAEDKVLMYADDSQVYISTPANDAAAAVAHLSACIADMNNDMKANRLRLNPSKTEVL